MHSKKSHTAKNIERPLNQVPFLPGIFLSFFEQNRGRYEQREVVVVREMDWWPKSWKWAGLQSVICVRRETMRKRHSAETPTVEMHYYLSSLKASAAELGRLIRNYWSVENECHHLLDVTFGEDHCQVRDKTAAHNLKLLRELSTKVLKSSPMKGPCAASASVAPTIPPLDPKSLVPFSMVLVRKPWQNPLSSAFFRLQECSAHLASFLTCHQSSAPSPNLSASTA